MCMCVFMCIMCMHTWLISENPILHTTYMHVCIHTHSPQSLWKLICAFFYMHTYIYVCMYTSSPGSLWKLICTPVCLSMSETVTPLPICMYVCMYVCVYVCMFAAYMHPCLSFDVRDGNTPANMYVCMYVCMYICTYVCGLYAPMSVFRCPRR